MDFVWTTLLATLPAIKAYFLAAAGFMAAERLIPAEKNQPLKNQWFSGLCTLLYFAATPFVVLWPAALAAKIFHATGGSLVSLNLDQLGADWATRNLALPFLPVLVFDFFYYWHHRLQHTIPALWAQHKLHHTEESLCCLTNLRHHWLEDGIRVFTITIPMACLVTLTPVQGAWVAVLISHWSMFFHANLRLPLGPLTPVLVGPQTHRIHHSREPKHADKNFAAFFPLWDILFGTYYRPRPGEWPATGLLSGERVASLWDAAILPFRDGWRGLAKLARARGKPGASR
jgi:sterol desaturase/sphingolipid hydroxylase (fatty acid hydroxylase superfamily)